MNNLSWRDALRLSEEREAKQQAKNDSAQTELQTLLCQLDETPVASDKSTVHAKPFYSSRVRIKTSLQECQAKDLERIVKVAQLMLDDINSEQQKQLRQSALLRRLNEDYRNIFSEDFSSFDKFISSLISGFLAEMGKKR